MGGFILLPEDELILVEHLRSAEGLLLLASDDLADAPPVIRGPLDPLCPGLLQAQARKTTEQPRELLRLHRRLTSWMKKQGVRTNPFAHAPKELPVEPPPNVGSSWVWAFPAAAAWVGEGGTLWPWNA